MSSNSNEPPFSADPTRPTPFGSLPDGAAELVQRAPLLSGCRALLSYWQQIGHDPRQLIQEAGVDAQLIDNPDASLPVEDRLRLWKVARAASGDPHFHLHVAERAPFGAYRIADFLCATAPTRDLALRKLTAQIASSDSIFRWSVVEEEDETSLVVEHSGVARQLTRRQAEYGFAVCLHRVRLSTGGDLAPLEVELQGPPEQDCQEIARSFGCMPCYQRAANRMSFRRADLTRENAYADRALFAILERRIAEAQAASSSLDPVLVEVRRLVMENLAQPLPVDRTARRLGMSGRSLQRRLRASGTSFSKLLEEARAQQARELLLCGDASLNDIAGALGFSEHSAFSRAFKRWTGNTPSEFRLR